MTCIRFRIADCPGIKKFSYSNIHRKVKNGTLTNKNKKFKKTTGVKPRKETGVGF